MVPSADFAGEVDWEGESLRSGDRNYTRLRLVHADRTTPEQLAMIQRQVLGGKARALLSGNVHVTLDDIKALVHSTLRHRILIGYRAEAEGVSVEDVIDRLLETVKAPGA